MALGFVSSTIVLLLDASNIVGALGVLRVLIGGTAIIGGFAFCAHSFLKLLVNQGQPKAVNGAKQSKYGDWSEGHNDPLSMHFIGSSNASPITGFDRD